MDRDVMGGNVIDSNVMDGSGIDRSVMDRNLRVTDLTVEIKTEDRSYRALDNITFHAKPGEMVALVGESGCGKSLSSLALMGLLPKAAKVTGGSICLGDTDLLTLSEEEMCKRRGADISMIFQEPMTALNPLMTVGKQIEEAYLLHHPGEKAAAREKTREMMKKVGLSRVEKLYHEYPHQLSGGMKQRIVIAMALINHPRLIVADEPTTALDVTIQYQILELLRELNQEFQSTILFISHDLGVVKELCSRIIVMYAGRIVEEGETEAILRRPIHPYTKGLLESIATPQKKGTVLYNIPGIVEPLAKRNPAGCGFVKRCPIAGEECLVKCPSLQTIEGRTVRCNKREGEAETNDQYKKATA